MELVTPAIGLIFWTTVVFTLLVLLLKKFAWKPILSAVDQRNQSIKESLAEAEKARTEMSELTANNEKILAQAKLDRDKQAYFGRAKTGFRKMATIPDIIAIKINQDHGINLHDTTFMRDRDKMKKLKYILTTEYPDLMVNN